MDRKDEWQDGSANMAHYMSSIMRSIEKKDKGLANRTICVCVSHEGGRSLARDVCDAAKKTFQIR